MPETISHDGGQVFISIANFFILIQQCAQPDRTDHIPTFRADPSPTCQSSTKANWNQSSTFYLAGSSLHPCLPLIICPLFAIKLRDRVNLERSNYSFPTCLKSHLHFFFLSAFRIICILCRTAGHKL